MMDATHAFVTQMVTLLVQSELVLFTRSHTALKKKSSTGAHAREEDSMTVAMIAIAMKVTLLAPSATASGKVNRTASKTDKGSLVSRLLILSISVTSL